jgi:acetyl esterase/lipase
MWPWCLILLTTLCAAAGQSTSARDWASIVGQRYEAVRDVVYKQAGPLQLKLDIYTRYDRRPGPTMIYVHGGGWANGTKEQYVLWFLPYLQLGMRVVSVQYRLSGVAPAPAAIQDVRCALYWVFQNAEKYGFDKAKIAITGGSAGGHLILMAGFLRPSDGFDNECSGPAPGPLKGIVDYYGPTDLVTGFDSTPGAIKWMGSGASKELAKRLSPLTYVRRGLPPVLIIHGDADEMVAFQDSVALRDALTKAGIPNELVTVPGGKHGRFRWTDDDTIRVQRKIESFLSSRGLTE